MNKIIRIPSLILMFIIMFFSSSVIAFASESGTPFPFSKYNDMRIEISSSVSDSLGENASYFAEGSISIMVYESSDDNKLRASQSAKFRMEKPSGLEYEPEGTNPSLSFYVAVVPKEERDDLVEHYQDAYDRRTMYDDYDEKGGYHYATISTGENTLFEEFDSNKKLDANSGDYVDGGKTHTKKRITPVSELPGMYLVIECSNIVHDWADDLSYAEPGFQKNDNLIDEVLNLSYDIIWQNDYYDSSASTTENPNSGSTNAGTTQNAEENPGEDNGVSVPIAIVIGVVAAGAAIAGTAGAFSSNSSNASDEDKKKRAYKMYVQKDFGDAIKKGAKEPSIIRARMAEIDELGKEHERNDLTAKISVSAHDMVIQNVALNGKYIEAKVFVPKDTVGEKASITFTFTGEGGTFDNTIIFKLVDGPHIEFISVGEEEGTNNENCGIHVIFGDSFTYDAVFKVVDATTPPKVEDIGASNITDFNVSFEETGTTSEFKMLVKNNSKALDNEEIFKKVKEEKFEISINLKDEEKPIKGYVTIKLHPEGISVESDEIKKKGEIEYIHIYAYEKANAGEMDNKYQSTEMKLYLAIKGKDKAIIDPKDAQYKIEKIKDSGGRGTKVEIERSIAEKYQYKEEFDNKNYQEVRYTFKPESNLVEPDDGSIYLVALPVSASYDGYNYDVDIPLRLCGIDKDPMEDWNKEYEKLKERIEKFSTPENKSKWMDKFYEITKDTKPSVEELRLTSKYVVMQYMRYWTVESEKNLDDAKMYDVIINYLEWAKFFGDCAFSMLLDAYAGPVASAFIAPAKDFFVSAIGEIIAAWHHGQKIDFDKFEFTSNLWAIGDNLLSDNISIANVKDALRTLSMYFAYSTLKNFYLKLRNENKFDIYGAIITGFTDMTVVGIKKMAGKLFDECMKKCAKFRTAISARVGAFVSKHLGEGKTIDLRVVDGISRTGYLRKILDGLFGDAVDKLFEKAGEIHDNFIESETNYEIDVDGHLIVTSYIDAFGYHYIYTVDVTQALINGLLAANPATFGMYIYNELFGNAPTASTKLIPPKDPPLPNKD